MKKFKKFSAVLLAFILMLSCMSITAYASETATQDGLSAVIETDKESYKANEPIKVTVNVTNTNDFAVKNVSIESLLPDGLTLKDGNLKSETVDLQAGEELTVSFTAIAEKDVPPATDPDTSEPTTGEPDTSKPDVTEPSTSEPDTSKPDITEPSTEPDTTKPNVTNPSTEPTTNLTGKTDTEEVTVDSDIPFTGTSTSAVVLKAVLVVLMVASVVFAIVMITKKNNKKATKIVSVVLSATIFTSSLVTSGMIAKAEDNIRSFSVDKTITVDGEECKIESNINYETLTENKNIKLYSDPKELSTSNDPQDVLFYIDTENSTDIYNVTLIDKKSGKRISNMLDDGLNGDKIANDGIYSTTLSVDCSEETTMQYYAVVDDGITKVKSRVREINIFAPMTDAEVENMATVDNRLTDLTESSEYVNASDDDKADFMKQTLENMLDEGLITDYQFLNDNAMVSYTYSNGLVAYWNIIPQNQNLDLSPEAFDKLLDGIYQNNIRYLKSTKANQQILYDEILFIYGWENSWDKKYPELSKDFNQQCIQTMCEYLPTVEKYKTLLTQKNYQYILIAEHGGEIVDNKKNYLATYIGTGETVTSAKDKQYRSDLKGKRILKVDGEYGLLSSFFSFYYENELGGAIVDMESCMGVGTGTKENYDYSTAFLYDCGASTYIGYHNPVCTFYALMMSMNIIEGLTSKNMNVGQAYVYAVDICGTTDVEFMYEYGPKLDPNWLVPDKETGKTDYEVIKEKDESGMAAYPVMTGSAKTTLNATVKFAGGDGSINNPYQIATAQQLNSVRYHLDSNFVLVDDIDLSEYENWEPIGGYIDVEPGDGLRGSFDGNGHSISNLRMNYNLKSTGDYRNDYSFGLFSDTKLSTGIKNVNLENVNIFVASQLDDEDDPNNASAINIAGLSTNASNISNVNVSGKIHSTLVCDFLRIGGISCDADRIVSSESKIDIIGRINGTNSEYPRGYVAIGGISSGLYDGFLNDCNNNGNIFIQSNLDDVYVSGLVADIQRSVVSNCNNYGNIEGSSYNIVHLAGISADVWSSEISNCANYGRLSARTYDDKSIYIYANTNVGGIISVCDGSDSGYTVVKNCANFGDLTAYSTSDDTMPDVYCAGIISIISSNVKISNCYNLAKNLEAQCNNASDIGKPIIGRVFATNSNMDTSIDGYSLDSTLLNGVIAKEEISANQKNGGSMSKAEIEKAVTDLGFELPA